MHWPSFWLGVVATLCYGLSVIAMAAVPRARRTTVDAWWQKQERPAPAPQGTGHAAGPPRRGHRANATPHLNSTTMRGIGE
jgi:hypothetical protein